MKKKARKICDWCKAADKAEDALIELVAAARESFANTPKRYLKSSLDGNCAVIVAANQMIMNISYCQCEPVIKDNS